MSKPVPKSVPIPAGVPAAFVARQGFPPRPCTSAAEASEIALDQARRGIGPLVVYVPIHIVESSAKVTSAKS